jgi:hypothetical protein
MIDVWHSYFIFLPLYFSLFYFSAPSLLRIYYLWESSSTYISSDIVFHDTEMWLEFFLRVSIGFPCFRSQTPTLILNFTQIRVLSLPQGDSEVALVKLFNNHRSAKSTGQSSIFIFTWPESNTAHCVLVWPWAPCSVYRHSTPPRLEPCIHPSFHALVTFELGSHFFFFLAWAGLKPWSSLS